MDTYRKHLVQSLNPEANIEILNRHIAILHERIDKEDKKDLESSADYFCWVRLNIDRLYIKLEQLKAINDITGSRLDKKNIKDNFSDEELAKSFKKKANYKSLRIFMQLRHCSCHLGIPYFAREIPSDIEKEFRKCFKDYIFIKKIFDDCNLMIDEEKGIRICFADRPAPYKVIRNKDGFRKVALE
jgi:hypothetical protein